MSPHGLTVCGAGQYADPERSGRSGAAEPFEPRQVREEAAVRRCLRVPPGCRSGRSLFISTGIARAAAAPASSLAAGSHRPAFRVVVSSLSLPATPDWAARSSWFGLCGKAGSRRAGERRLKYLSCLRRIVRWAPCSRRTSSRSRTAVGARPCCRTPGRERAGGRGAEHQLVEARTTRLAVVLRDRHLNTPATTRAPHAWTILAHKGHTPGVPREGRQAPV